MQLLGLNRDLEKIPRSMITSCDSIKGFEILEMMGVVDAVVEGSFPYFQMGHIGIQKGGGLEDLVFSAKEELARAASERGGNAIVGFRYELMGRQLEKSIVAYGTAVRCRKCTTSSLE